MTLCAGKVMMPSFIVPYCPVDSSIMKFSETLDAIFNSPLPLTSVSPVDW